MQSMVALLMLILFAGCSASGGEVVGDASAPAESSPSATVESIPVEAAALPTTTSLPSGAVSVLARSEPPGTSGTFSSMLALGIGRVSLRGECLVLDASGKRVGVVMPYGTSVIDDVVHFADGAQLILGSWAVGGGFGSRSAVADGRACQDVDEYWITGPFSDCCRSAPGGFGTD